MIYFLNPDDLSLSKAASAQGPILGDSGPLQWSRKAKTEYRGVPQAEHHQSIQEPGTRNQPRREAFVPEGLDEALLASETKGGGESRSGKDEASDFLRELLASGALPVLEIEQEARDAGLLGPDSPISQNKSLRSARDILGITPQRKGGTGAKGQWVWELSATPKMPSKPYDALFLKEGTLGNSGHLSGSETSS